MFKKLLVPLDGSGIAEQALPIAAAIAKASGASLDLIRAHQPLPPTTVHRAQKESDEWRAADSYLESIAKELAASPGVATTHAAPKGDPAEAIQTRAKDVHADLIVLTSHGRTGFSRFWMGSVADALVRGSEVPVLMVRPAAGAPAHGEVSPLFSRVLVPLDGSQLSSEALSAAADLARCRNATVMLLHVAPPVPMPAALSDGNAPVIVDRTATDVVVREAYADLGRAMRTLQQLGVEDVETDVVVDPHVASAIVEYARGHQAQVIAMSTHGRGASRMLIGSVADKVLRGSGLPVVLWRPKYVAAMRLDAAEVEEQLPALSG